MQGPRLRLGQEPARRRGPLYTALRNQPAASLGKERLLQVSRTVERMTYGQRRK